MNSSRKPEAGIFFVLVLAAAVAGCSKGDGSVTDAGPDSSSPPQVGVTVTPSAASILTIQPQQFTATVVNSDNPAVLWKVDGVQGGNTSTGVISFDGLYIPPPRETTHSITATSVEDPTRSDSASVTVKLPPQTGVTVTPAAALISPTQKQQFTATVVNSKKSSTVTWKVDGVQGGNASVGVISTAGLYTPSSREATHSIIATSVEDPAKTGSASVTVRFPPQIGVTVTPAAASISTAQTQQFTGTVVNSTNPALTWKVDGVQGGNAAVGVISSAGLYTPSAVAATHTITATSVQDPTKSDNATVTVTLPSQIGVTVAPAIASISTVQTQQFTATVVNSTNPAVTWQVDGVQGGNTGVGVISAGGLYTPSAVAATHTITATSVQDPTKKSSASVTVRLPSPQTGFSGVLTYHNDNARTGQNLQETVLTPANVRSATFGKLFSFPVDGYVYAQPLYVSNVTVAGQLRNVVFVATEHNSVYAFDADNRTSAPLWQKSFLSPGVTTVPSSDNRDANGNICGDISPEIGITSTPVIDPATGILYVVAKTKEGGVPKYRIHALDITTGADTSGAGVEVQASVPGTARPNLNGRLVFNAQLENQRTALLLSNNVVYFGTSSYCDFGDHHGWFLAYDSSTLNLLGAFNATPNGLEGGIWQSGGGAAADASGNVYVITGDGTFDASSGGNNYGDSMLKFAGASLAVTDYFTPSNQNDLARVNADLGSGGALLLPDQSAGPPHLMVGAGKQGIVYLVNRDNMGKFQPGSDSQIVQSFSGGPCAGGGSCAIFGTPAYYNNTVYTVAVDDGLKAYSLVAGRLSLSARSTNTFQWPGATPAISANGPNNGIVWALETNGSGARAVLHAYSAASVSVELYNSNQNSARDNPGAAVKFAVPTIANGKVYVGAQGQLSVFGLLP